jgi:hypothetical protein
MAGALDDVPDNAPQRSTQCGNVGHNRTTCDEVCQLPIVYLVESRTISNGLTHSFFYYFD